MWLSRLLLELAGDLNDDEPGFEFQSFSPRQLVVWLNEGLQAAFTLKPTAFAHTRVLRLRAGADQHLNEFAILHRIHGQCDAAGVVVMPLAKTSPALAARWTRAPDPLSASAFRLNGYAFDPLEGGLFRVSPPVPPAAEVFVLATGYVRPDPLSHRRDVELKDDALTQACKQWVLLRALLRDNDSATAATTAQTHAQLFFQLLGLQYSQELAHAIGMAGGPARVPAMKAGA